LDWIKLGITAADNYGDGSSDTVDFYVYNLAILDNIPAITDNEPSTDVDINQGDNIATYGDDTYYLSHNQLQPVISAATNNEYNTKVYLDKDFPNGGYLLNTWRHITFAGTAKIDADPARSSVSWLERTGPDYVKHVDLWFNFNQMRHSDSTKNIASTFAPSYTAQYFKIKTDDNVFYSPEKSYDEDINNAYVDDVKKQEDFASALANQNDNTWVNLYTYSSVKTEGASHISYDLTTEVGPSSYQEIGMFPGLGTKIYSSTGIIIGLALIGLIAIAIRKRRR